jgi:glucose/arabinose dehydrogenase
MRVTPANFRETERTTESTKPTLMKIIRLASAYLVFLATGLSAATLPAGFSESVLASGIGSSTAMEFAPDGRLFVCQQGGQLRVIKDGVLVGTPS